MANLKYIGKNILNHDLEVKNGNIIGDHTEVIKVTVVSDGGNKYAFEGATTPDLTIDEGKTYRFDQSDSTNDTHPFRFSVTENGTWGGGSAYSTGVTTHGTPGVKGAYTEISVTKSTPNHLYYYCTAHSGMGNDAVLLKNDFSNLHRVSGSSTSTGSFGELEVDTNTTIGGNLTVGQYIYHKDDTNTYLNFSDDRLRFNIGGISYIDLNDSTSAPHDITFNDGGNNVDLTIKGSSNNPLFKTDASHNRIGTHGIGSPKVAFHIGGSELRVDGNISGSSTGTGSFGKVIVSEMSNSDLKSVSSSISTRLTTEESNVDTLQARDLIAGTGLTGGGTLASDRTFNVVGGTGITANANDIQVDFSDSTLQTTISGSLGSNATLIRSLTAAGISGSFTPTSSSLASRLTTEEGNVDTLQARDLIAGTGLTGGGTLASDRTFNVVGGTGITANANDIEIDFSDSTLQTTISGSVTSVSSSLAGRITTEEGNVDTLQARDLIAGAGLTGGGTLASDRTFNIGAGTGVTVNANDVAIGQAVATSDNVTFGSVTTTGNISGSSTSTGSFGRVESNTFNATTFTSTEVTSTNLTVTGTITGSSLDVSGNGNFGGDLVVGGDITAENYIVKSNVTQMTQSFSSGSTIFGDTSDDTHQFTGSLSVSGSNLDVRTDENTKLRVRRNNHSTAAIELSFRGSTGGLIHATSKELDISTAESGISLLPASGIVSINDNSTQTVKPSALSIQKISGINYLSIADAANSAAEGNIFLITGSNGNVGIANKDPQEKLDVTGNIQASGNISGSSTSTGSFGRGFIDDRLDIGTNGVTLSDTAKGLNIYSGAPQLHLESTGNARMNFSTPSGKKVSLFASNTSPTTFRIMYDGASKHTFHDNAGLSIGTQTNPGSSSFHAVGDITGSNLKIGDVVSSGNISGSSTSTGSFGRVESSTSNVSGNATIGGNLLITGSAAPKLTFNRAGEGSADIYFNSGGTGLIVDSGAPIQLDYTTSLRILKAGSETARFTGNGGLAFGDSSSTTSVLTIKSDSNSPISFEKSSNRQNYLEFKKTSGNLTQPWLIGVGTDATGTEFRVSNGSTTALTIASGSGNATFGGNISGSSTSTGSFGAGYIDNKLGIGTTAPTGMLHIQRSALTGFDSYDDDDLILERSGDYSNVNLASDVGSYLLFSDATRAVGTLGYVHSGDYLTIGVAGVADHVKVTSTKTTFTQTQGIELINTGNNTVFHIPSSAGYTFGTQTNNHMSMWTNNTERIRILNSGNVGIGETSPDELLHIKSSTSAKPVIKIENTNTDVNGGGLIFLKNTSDEAANDVLGTVRFKGNNDAAEEIEFATIYARSSDVSDGSEDGKIHFRTMKAGTLDDALLLSSGNVEFPTATTISGSSTSTGSFGNLRVGDNTAHANRFTAYGGDEGFKVGYAQSGFLAHDGQGTEGVDAEISMTGTGGSAPFDNHGSIVYKTRAVSAIARSSHIFYTGRASAERVRIDHLGNVGIGIAAPSSPLHVYNANSSLNIKVERGDGSSGIVSAGGSTTFFGTDDTTDVEIGTNSTTRMFIDHSETAITFPTITKISGSSTSTGSFGSLVVSDKVQGNINFGGTTNIFRTTTADQSTMVRIDQGTAQYGGKLHFGGLLAGNADYVIGEIGGIWNYDTSVSPVSLIRFETGADTTNRDDGRITFWTSAASRSPAERMRIDYNGNVGIGTTSPAEALHVAGKAYIRRTGTATAHGDTDLFVADSTAGGSTAQLQILGGASGASLLYFSDTNSYSVGGIKYFHSDNRMTFRANDTDILDITSTKISGSSTSTGSFGAVTIGAVPDNDVDHPFELQGNMRIDGDIYSFSSGVRGYPRRYISFGLGLELYTAGDTHEYNHKLKNMSGRNLLWVSGDGAKVSGSSDSTGSFGRVEANSISASLYQGQIGSRYVHSQTSDSATWTINHNIGQKYPVVTVYDDSDQMILPQNGVATDSDTFTLTFNEAIQGKAVVSVGGIGTNAGGNYIHTQSDSSTNWNVTHSLSQQYPNITVFDENDEVILPETITALDDNHSTITFSGGKTGYANFSIGSGIPNITHANAGKVLKVRSDGTGVEWSPTSNDVSGSMSVSGSILPTIDNFHDLGSETQRWANLYTGDIELSNEGSEGNEVDGTTGSWTIQEGEDDLYLLNRKNGKKYKFKLEEIT